MNKRVSLLVVVCALGVAGVAAGQGRILDMVANKVIQKYQTSSCEQLWQQKGQPKSQEEERAVNFLRNDSQARTEFNEESVPDGVAERFVDFTKAVELDEQHSYRLVGVVFDQPADLTMECGPIR